MRGFLSFLSFSSMADTNDLRLFEELRLHPSVPEHDLKIRAFLAALAVTDPSRGQMFKEKYDEKMRKYLEENPPVVEETPSAPDLPPLSFAEIHQPKKRGRKPKVHSEEVPVEAPIEAPSVSVPEGEPPSIDLPPA